MKAPWLKFLAWSELLAGAGGFIILALFDRAHADQVPWWQIGFTTSFLTASAIAGFLLIRGEVGGLRLSVLVQALQLIGFSIGWRYVAAAGLELTPIVSTTGFGVLAGAEGQCVFGDAVDGTLNGLGLGAGITLGVWPNRPLKDSTATVGVNLVALFFLVRLLRLKKEMSQTAIDGAAA